MGAYLTENKLRDVGTGVVAGLALGLFCALADHWTETTWLGQMATPWVLVAAFVGSKGSSVKKASVLGVMALIVATTVYYVVAAADRGLTTLKFTLIWTGLSLIVGSLFGAIGWAIRFASARSRVLGVGALASVPLAESILLWPHIGQPGVTASFVFALAIAVAPSLFLLHGLGKLERAASALLSLILGIPLVILFELAFRHFGILGI